MEYFELENPTRDKILEGDRVTFTFKNSRYGEVRATVNRSPVTDELLLIGFTLDHVYPTKIERPKPTLKDGLYTIAKDDERLEIFLVFRVRQGKITALTGPGEERPTGKEVEGFISSRMWKLTRLVRESA